MKNKEEIRKKERAKYTKWYFENVYWAEDSPHKKHHRNFRYNDPSHKKRFQFLTKLLVQHFEFDTFLDAGSGMGHMVRNLLKRGYNCKGVEISKDALKYYMPDLVEKGVVHLASLDKLPFKANQFDLTFCSDVMEHVPIFDVQESIKELIRVTRKYLVLTINLDNPYEYHPTILSRETWEIFFLETKKMKQLIKLQKILNKECEEKYKEYDFFVFRKLT